MSDGTARASASASASATILAIGDELTLGEKLDTNSRWLASQLVRLGYRVSTHATLGDDVEQIRSFMERSIRDDGLLVCTGGLGPTADDVTRDALAALVAQPLMIDPDALRRLEVLFRRRGREVNEYQRRQAMRPEGASCLPNTVGTAPGLRLDVGDATVLCLPGPPRELVPMFERAVEPLIARPDRPVTSVMHAVGLAESTGAERLGSLLDRGQDPEVGITASAGIVSIRIRSFSGDAARLDAARARSRDALGALWFGDGAVTLAESLVDRLRARGESAGTVESCTGGLIGAAITAVPGSSAVYPGGWVTYSNDQKTAQAGVPAGLFDTDGAVSGPVVSAMAAGAIERLGVDHAISVSGIAGPDGGSDEKPVGTVWIGAARCDGGSIRTNARRFQIPGDREMIRAYTVTLALGVLHQALVGGGGGAPEPLLFEMEPAGPELRS